MADDQWRVADGIAAMSVNQRLRIVLFPTSVIKSATCHPSSVIRLYVIRLYVIRLYRIQPNDSDTITERGAPGSYTAGTPFT